MIDTPAIEKLLGELEALRAAATEGTWSWEDGPPTVYAGRVDPVGEFGGWPVFGHGYNLFGRLNDLSHNGCADLNLAVGAVNAMPTLITTIRALMEAVEAERERCAMLADAEKFALNLEATDGSILSTGGMAAASRIAAAIRSKGDA